MTLCQLGCLPMRIRTCKKTPLFALMAFSMSLAAFVLGAPNPQLRAEEQAPRKVLEALDALSPSNPDPKDLVAFFQLRTAISDEEVRRHIGCDSLAFISLEGMVKAFGADSFCKGCFNGEYPV